MSDIIIKNGKCLTMKEETRVDWIAINSGKISDIGTGNEYEKHVNGNTRVIDANGASVLPGFIDSDFHVLKSAVSERSLDLSKATDFRQMEKMIRREALNKPGKTIIANRVDATCLKEGKFPDRTILDRFCNNAPLVIYSADLHVIMLNTYGILFYKAPFTLNGVELDQNGMPTGIFRNQAGAILDINIMSSFSNEDLDEAINNLLPKLFKVGITTVAAMEGGNIKAFFGEDYECEYIYKHGHRYPLSMELYYQTTEAERVESMRLDKIGGALYVDGTMGERTAYFSFDYADAPGKKGLCCFEKEHLESFVFTCCEKGIQIAFDAIGDAAIEMVLKAFEKASSIYDIKTFRHRIEHGEFMTEEQMLRASKMGILLSMQPAYEGKWGHPGGMYSQRLGAMYGHTNEFRKVIDTGIIICGGSDSPVTEANPMLGIHHAVNHPIEKHSVTVAEALRMFTVNGAYGIFKEKEIGTIEVGKNADIVVLDKDIEKVNPACIKDIDVIATIKAGELLYDRCV